MFRKRTYVPSSPSEPVLEYVESFRFDENGVQRQVVSSVDVSSDSAKSALPTYEEYSLERLLSSGISLEAINTASFINPSDRATLDSIGLRLSSDAFTQLKSYSDSLSKNNPE